MGMVERVVQMVKQQLKEWAHEREYQGLDDWPGAVPHTANNINGRLMRDMGTTPNEIMLGWPLRMRPLPGNLEAPRVTRDDEAVMLAQLNLTQHDMTMDYIEHRRDIRHRMEKMALDKVVDQSMLRSFCGGRLSGGNICMGIGAVYQRCQGQGISGASCSKPAWRSEG